MNPFLILLRGLLLISCAAAPVLHAAKPASPPNVIVILADDLGYSDPSCFGGEIETPALDRMAREGVRMTRFHNAGMCVISRTSLLTGRWWPSGKRNFETSPLLPENSKTPAIAPP
jgi:hypothetical protein